MYHDIAGSGWGSRKVDGRLDEHIFDQMQAIHLAVAKQIKRREARECQSNVDASLSVCVII